MGDMADMMLGGVLCQHCGSYLGGKPSGVPTACMQCGDRETKNKARAASKAQKRRLQRERARKRKEEPA